VDVHGVLDLHPDGYGFLRSDHYYSGENDTYVPPQQVRRFRLKTGDYIEGITREKTNEKFNALIYVKTVNGDTPENLRQRPDFDDFTPIYPDKRITLEHDKHILASRLVDLIAPIGRGQRGLLVSPPKAGKTTLLKQIANAISVNHPDIEIIVLLIDERPEEVTDIRRSVQGDVIASTFDELPQNHVRISEIVLERAKRLVEHGKDVVILLDSITRLTRAYNLVQPASGKILSGGIDPSAFHKPKRFFGAARNIEHGGSLTIIATALVDTGSRMDDVIYEEFKGTGNMELHLDRDLANLRIYPAIDIVASGTRREESLLSDAELNAMVLIRRLLQRDNDNSLLEKMYDSLRRSDTNSQFIQQMIREGNGA
jgi:transcription termination factor Rho